MARERQADVICEGSVDSGQVTIAFDGYPSKYVESFTRESWTVCEQLQERLLKTPQSAYLGQALSGADANSLRVYEYNSWHGERLAELSIPHLWEKCWYRAFCDVDRLSNSRRLTFRTQFRWHALLNAVEVTIIGKERTDHFRVRALPDEGNRDRIATFLWTGQGCIHDQWTVDDLPMNVHDPAMASAVDTYLTSTLMSMMYRCEVCSLRDFYPYDNPDELLSAAKLVQSSRGGISSRDMSEMSRLLVGSDQRVVDLVWNLHCDRPDLPVRDVCDSVLAATA